MNLSNEIMNLPCKRTMSHFLNHEDMQLYKEGHRDALHAAAEMALKANYVVAALEAILHGMEASGGWEGDDELFELGMEAIRKYEEK